MAPIVPPGAFMNQLQPNPHTLLQKKTHNSAITKTVLKRGRERERERERAGGKGTFLSFFRHFCNTKGHFCNVTGTFVTVQGILVTFRALL